MASPTATAEKERGPEKKRGLPGGLTGNALVSGVVSAIVAGVISFTVAHYQDQDAARQAVAGLQASAAIQLETAATAVYQDAFATYSYRLCALAEFPSRACLFTAAPTESFSADMNTFGAALANISDPLARRIGAQFAYAVHNSLPAAGTSQGRALYDDMNETYGELIVRCGQLIQGQG